MILSFEIWSNMASGSTSADSEGSVFKVLEGVIYYVDLTCDHVSLCFSCGGKECLIQLLNLTSAAPLLKYLSARMLAMPSDKNESNRITGSRFVGGNYTRHEQHEFSGVKYGWKNKVYFV